MNLGDKIDFFLLKKKESSNIVEHRSSRNKISILTKSDYPKYTNTMRINTTSTNNNTLTMENPISTIKRNINSKDIKYKNRSSTIRRKKKKQRTIFQPKNMNKIIIHDILFYTFSIQKKISFEKIRTFLINIQRKVKAEYASNSWEISNNNDDNNKIKKLESLIAKYSIIIYYLIRKKKVEEAKNIFLLMLKENMPYIDYHSLKLFKIFNKLQLKYEILKVYPKMTKGLFNIYSFIIKYCIFFNFTKYKNKFLVRYLALLSLNYKVFKIKIEMRGFSVGIKNQIKYWFASGLHYASYFTLNSYCSPKIPISISGLILKLYRNLEESKATKQEKSLLIKTSYNQGILYYINDQCDQALKALKLTKQKIMSFYEIEHNEFNNINKVLQIVDNSKINGTITLNNNNIRQNNSFFFSYNKELLFNSNLINHSFKNTNDFFEQIFINEGYRKKNLKIEDISKLLSLNSGEIPKGLDKNKLNNKNSSPIPDMKGNQNEIDKFKKKREFNIPHYLKQPFFLDIELFMTEIEIDRKNYILSFEHIKNCLFLILLGESNQTNNNMYRRELSILSKYLEEIEKNNKDKKLLSKIKYLQNKLSLNHYKEDERIKEMIKSIIENNNNSYENNVNTEKIKNEKEIEKFFIFLNSLSIYQIKILNETQPTNDARNDLPIFFHNQFKDTLSTTQRLNLSKLYIMSLSRSAILNDPNDYILPSNLKFNSGNKRKNKNYNNTNISFNGSLMNNDTNSIIDDNNNKNINNNYDMNKEKKYAEFVEDNFKFENTKEFENFKKIIFSKNSDKDFKLYLLNNFVFVMTILKKSEDNEIKDMIEFPEIIIEPIKSYKRKNKNKVKYINENKREIINQLMKYPEFKCLLNIDKKVNRKNNKSYNQSLSSESLFSFSAENEI